MDLGPGSTRAGGEMFGCLHLPLGQAASMQKGVRAWLGQYVGVGRIWGAKLSWCRHVNQDFFFVPVFFVISQSIHLINKLIAPLCS